MTGSRGRGPLPVSLRPLGATFSPIVLGEAGPSDEIGDPTMNQCISIAEGIVDKSATRLQSRTSSRANR